MGRRIALTLFPGNGMISKHFKKRRIGVRTGKLEGQVRAAEEVK